MHIADSVAYWTKQMIYIPRVCHFSFQGFCKKDSFSNPVLSNFFDSVQCHLNHTQSEFWHFPLSKYQFLRISQILQITFQSQGQFTLRKEKILEKCASKVTFELFSLLKNFFSLLVYLSSLRL